MNFIILNNKKYRYNVYPNKNTEQCVVFLLGALQDIESVENLSTEFSKYINCITVEIPGTGLADAIPLTMSIKDQTSMLLDFIHHMNIIRAHIVAFSYATAIAIELCNLWPNVASISTFGGVPGIPSSGLNATKKMIAASVENPEKFAKVFAKSLIADRPEVPRSKSILRATQRAVANLPREQINAFFDNSVRLLTYSPSHLDKICIPCTICTGEFDPYATVEIVKDFSNKINNTNFVVLKNSDHMAHLEHPRSVAEIMIALAKADVEIKTVFKKFDI